MAIGYLVLTLVIIVMNYHLIPHVFKVIVLDAFGFTQIAGGGIGAAMMNGIKRGLFSNEAGEGSAPNVAATAVTTHPVKQGLIQALGVFTDTLVVCSCTAFILLISGKYFEVRSIFPFDTTIIIIFNNIFISIIPISFTNRLI